MIEKSLCIGKRYFPLQQAQIVAYAINFIPRRSVCSCAIGVPRGMMPLGRVAGRRPEVLEQSLKVLWFSEKGGIEMYRKRMLAALAVLLVVLLPCSAAFAAGEVASAIEETWSTAAAQVKDVVNNVVFPIIDCVLAVLLFAKLAMSYFEYKKHGEFDFQQPAILFFGLLFSLTAPLYVWNIIGI